MAPSSAEMEEEQIHFANIIATFRQYAQYSLSANNRRRKDLYSLSRADKTLIDELGYKEKLNAVDEAILANARFLEQVVEDPQIFGFDDASELGREEDEAMEPAAGRDLGPPPSHTHSGRSHSHSDGHPHSHSHGPSEHRNKIHRPTDFDMDKLRSTLKQFVRDWSAEGKAERDACYVPVQEALLAHFSDIPAAERHNLRVLVPGAGLGRLAWDIAKLGFSCQGNEFSHYMLFGSFFILNRTQAIDAHTIYPFIHTFSNIPNRDALLRSISFPDVLPSSLPPSANFSLVAGDFEEIYGDEDDIDGSEPHAGQWDAILTCFFIDTAKNIVNYLRIIHRILAPGGVWINMGPLLWHWENNTSSEPSIELSLDEVKALARKIGFEIKNERTISTTYTSNPQSMLGYMYDAAFWTATKVM